MIIRSAGVPPASESLAGGPPPLRHEPPPRQPRRSDPRHALPHHLPPRPPPPSHPARPSRAGVLVGPFVGGSLGWRRAGAMADGGPGPPGPAALAGRLRFLALPGVTPTLVQLGAYTRFRRGAMIEALRQDYIRTARA